MKNLSKKLQACVLIVIIVSSVLMTQSIAAEDIEETDYDAKIQAFVSDIILMDAEVEEITRFLFDFMANLILDEYEIKYKDLYFDIVIFYLTYGEETILLKNQFVEYMEIIYNELNALENLLLYNGDDEMLTFFEPLQNPRPPNPYAPIEEYFDFFGRLLYRGYSILSSGYYMSKAASDINRASNADDPLDANEYYISATFNGGRALLALRRTLPGMNLLVEAAEDSTQAAMQLIRNRRDEVFELLVDMYGTEEAEAILQEVTSLREAWAELNRLLERTPFWGLGGDNNQQTLPETLDPAYLEFHATGGVGVPIEQSRIDINERARNSVCPLAINPNGRIETVPFRDGVHFDHLGNGMSIRTSWVAPNTALLARDINGNGIIDNGRELFGNGTMLNDGTLAPNGFIALRELDTNNDGIFDRSDSYFFELYLWFDKNTNGITDPGELVPLSESDIESFDLDYEESDFIDRHGNFFKQISSATMLDGREVEFIDIWFIRNIPRPAPVLQSMPEMFGIMAMSNGYEDEELRRRVEALPQIGAFGTAFDLHTMMMLDEQLLLLVEAFVAEENPGIRRSLVPQIIHRWTGATTNLAALEALTGEIYTGPTHHVAMGILNRGFDRVASSVYAALGAQSHLWHLYEHAIFIEGTEDFPEFNIVPVAYEILRIASDDPDAKRQLVMDYVSNMRTLIMLDAVNLQEFRAVLAAEDALLGWTVDMAKNAPDMAIWGTMGDDVIVVSGNLNQYVFGMGGNDTITVTGWGDNRINPGVGNNVIFGGHGADTYVIGRGYGFNTITANASHSWVTSDRLELTDGIHPDEVFFVRVGNNLQIHIAESGELVNGLPIFEEVTNVVTIVGFFVQVRQQIVDISFDCGAIITQAEMIDRGRFIVGTNGDDLLIVPDARGHTVYGRAGNDEIRPTSGINRIYPGPGDNVIIGGMGTDTYVIGRGHGFNTITANASHSWVTSDRLELTDGIRTPLFAMQ